MRKPYKGMYHRDLTPVTSEEEYIALFSNPAEKRRVALTDLGDMGRVSTVFLRMDHGYGDGPPVLFETLVFGGPRDGEMERYCTEWEALRGHHKMVAEILRSRSLWQRFKDWMSR